MFYKMFTVINLQLFAEGGGEGAASGDASGSNQPSPSSTKASKNPLADVQYGTGNEQASPPQETIVTSDTEADKNAIFEGLIKGEYKAEFDSRVQRIINNRFKGVDVLKEKAAKLDSYTPMLNALATKYGIASTDPDAIIKAVEEDNSYYEDEAMREGITVEQLKHMKRLERENSEFQKAIEEQRRMNAKEEVFRKWDTESAQCAQRYPSFNFDSEAQNPETGGRFLSLLGAGISVQDAYELIHKDDIISGAMQYTAQQVQAKTVNDIRARGMRPAENGTSGAAPATIVKKDPAKFTKKDREEISRRVLRGDRSITFN